MSLFFSQLFNGLQTGSVYALVALGYSMVYGIILLLNFAHGDIIMVGAYTAFYAMTTFHLHPLVSVLLAIIASTALGVLIEKVAYTPLRQAPRLSLLITAIGISFLLENGAQLLFGAVMQISQSFAVGAVPQALNGFPSTDYAPHTIINHIYDYGTVRYELGYACAISTVLLIAMLLSNKIINKLLGKE